MDCKQPSNSLVTFRYEIASKKVVAVFPYAAEKSGDCLVVCEDGESYTDNLRFVFDTTKQAQLVQYDAFYDKLVKMGWSLKVITLNDEGTIAYHRAPNETEIKFGYGAEHYIDVFFTEVIDKEGNIKEHYTSCKGEKYKRA